MSDSYPRKMLAALHAGDSSELARLFRLCGENPDEKDERGHDFSHDSLLAFSPSSFFEMAGHSFSLGCASTLLKAGLSQEGAKRLLSEMVYFETTASALRELIDSFPFLKDDLVVFAALSASPVAMRIALSLGGNPRVELLDGQPVIRYCISKERSLSGEALLGCAKLLREHGVSLSEALFPGEKSILDAYEAETLPLWTSYLSDSGASLRELLSSRPDLSELDRASELFERDRFLEREYGGALRALRESFLLSGSLSSEGKASRRTI